MLNNDLMSQLIAAGRDLGGSMVGQLAEVGDLQKALTATGSGTDVANLTGGASLTIQSLDKVMKSTVMEQEHFVFTKDLVTTNATNIVDEYVRKNSVGGFPGGSTNTQMGVVRTATGDYSREVGLVKFLMQLRQVGFVLNISNNIVSAMSEEETNGALSLLQDMEYLLFYGNSEACPTHFDGIFKQIDDAVASGYMSDEHIYNMDGKPLTTVEPFSAINQAVFNYGSWGKVTNAYLPSAVQTDLNLGLDPAFRWNPQGSNTPMIGAHVDAIRLTHGPLKLQIDTFLHDDKFPMALPFEVNFSALATANDAFKPQSVTVATASDASSKFTASRDGNYYWAVAGIGPAGEGLSTVAKTTQTAVAAGEKATLTITASAGNTESGYAIYRSRQDGTNATSDFRLFKIVKKAGATTTVVDLNTDIPGTSAIPLLNMNSAADAIGWRQFQSMLKIPLPFGVGGVPVYSWFQFLFGYLRVTKPRHHGYIKNILPSTATWRPFTNE
jgi:hypothetical protein